MILEHVLLPITPGRESEFERAFADARAMILSMHGCHSATIARGIETPATYLLLVEWDTLEDHVVGFHGSPEYETWKARLHHFYETPPVVEHFAPMEG